MPFPGVEGAHIGDHLVAAGFHVTIGDLVFFGSRLGRVVACFFDASEADAASSYYLIVDELEHKADISSHSSVWNTDTTREQVWLVTQCLEVVAWQLAPARSELIAVRM